MSRVFATLFNLTYLPQGLAMIGSLHKQLPGAEVWVLCLDNLTHRAISDLGLASVHAVHPDEFESEELLKVKPSRTVGEFAWTLTPFVFSTVFSLSPSTTMVTYVDADLFFYKDPGALLKHFSEDEDAAVLITPHNYAPEYDQTERSGEFCVQFLSAKVNRSSPIIKFWGEQCLDWCFDRIEEGKFGDQKYLDQWPQLYGSAIYVLSDEFSCQAPWNASKMDWKRAVFFHFHGLKIRRLFGRIFFVMRGRYRIPNQHINGHYLPYLEEVKTQLSDMDTGLRQNVIASIGTPSFVDLLGAGWWLFHKHSARISRSEPARGFWSRE